MNNNLDKMKDSERPPVIKNSDEFFKKVNSLPESQMVQLENNLQRRQLAQNPSHKNKKHEKILP